MSGRRATIHNIPSHWDMSLINLAKIKAASKADKDHNSVVTQEQLVLRLMYDDHSSGFIARRDSIYLLKPKHCPSGLEALFFAKHSLIVLRRPENAVQLNPQQRLLAFAQYDIVDEEGHQLYLVAEQTTKSALRWTRDARMFCCTMYDQKGKKIMTISRECTAGFFCAQYYCLFCMFGFKGCGNEAVVTLADGETVLGRISQDFSYQLTILNIYDKMNEKIMSISGKLKDGMFDVWLSSDNDQPVAMIETSMTVHEVSAFYNIQVSSYEDPYGLTFFSLALSPKNKAMIIAAIILMDYIFCKPNSDYPHWTQCLPTDFIPEDQTQEKLFSDGSKEIIVTSMKPKHNRINMIRNQRICSCCRWFFGFICVCFPIGCARNGLRCTQLIIFGILLLAGVLCLICILYIYPNKKGP